LFTLVVFARKASRLSLEPDALIMLYVQFGIVLVVRG
jgi:hypothetical protein